MEPCCERASIFPPDGVHLTWHGGVSNMGTSFVAVCFIRGMEKSLTLHT